MTDLHNRFRTLDKLSAPNLWSDIEERALAMQPARRRGLLVLVVVTLLLVLAIGGAVLVGSGILKLPVLVDASATPSSTAQASSSASSTPTPTPVPPEGWNAVEIRGIDWLTDIAEHDGRLVALGEVGGDQPGTAMAFSDDGQVWTAIDLSAFDLTAVFTVFGGELGFGAIAARSVPGELAGPVYLFSADGETWEAATPPTDCTLYTGPAVLGQFGFMLGSACRLDPEAPPGSPLFALTSVDGRAWTSRLAPFGTDAERSGPGPWATDGRRLVFLTNAGSLEPVSVWLTDDLGETWRYVESPFPANVSVYGLIWGHGRFVAKASWLLREGDPDPAVCVSEDGETWHCEVIAATGDLADRDYLGELIGVTPTGFISLAEYPDDLFAPSGTSLVMATSTDGLQWTFALLPDMANRIPTGVAGTSHGLFTWGQTNPIEDPGEGPQPYIQVHGAPLP